MSRADARTIAAAMLEPDTMSRRDRLRRVVILCYHFSRNLCFYRAGHATDYAALFDPSMNPAATFWIQTHNNFRDTCILEWCKLFGDRKSGKHHWSKTISNPAQFERDLLGELGVNSAQFQLEIDRTRAYRDKFVAHLDSEATGYPPKFDLHLKSVQFYHRQVMAYEANLGDLELPHNLRADMNRFCSDCEEVARIVYGRAVDELVR